MSNHPAADHEAHQASITVKVTDAKGVHAVLSGASIALYHCAAGARCEAHQLLNDAKPIKLQRTDDHGSTTFHDLVPGDSYVALYLNYPKALASPPVTPAAGCCETICLAPEINASIKTVVHADDCQPLHCRQARPGDNLVTTVEHASGLHATIVAPAGLVRLHNESDTRAEYAWTPAAAGHINRSWLIRIPVLARHGNPGAGAGAGAGTPAAHSYTELRLHEGLEIVAKTTIPVSGKLGISLSRTETEATADLPLWVAIRNGTEALSFNNYLHFIDLLFCANDSQGGPRYQRQKALYGELTGKRYLPFTDTDAYRVLKAATEAFVMVNCAVLSPPDFDQRDDNGYLDRRDLPAVGRLDAAFEHYLEPLGPMGKQRVLPYLALVRRKLPDIPVTHADRDEDNLCVGFVQDKLANPCMVELIWSYWLEEAMLVQTMNAVTRRFQNMRSPSKPDPLANLEIDPLRPLNNLIWGYTQDEQHRLTVNRRNYEYDHHYGMRLQGRAVQAFRPADTRSQFLEAFHHLLRLATIFYKQDDDTTVKADAFPVLNALKEVHLVMSQGAHNQFGDLPSTARIEMLMQQWLLARPEFREFLPTRIMVAYPEPWMDRVDAMKKLQGWTDTSVVHFRNLAIFGEQLLLSIRYGAWSEVYEPTQAFNWARFWRPQIQGYNHAYRAATGVELSGDTADTAADATLPSLLLQKRLAVQQRSA